MGMLSIASFAGLSFSGAFLFTAEIAEIAEEKS